MPTYKGLNALNRKKGKGVKMPRMKKAKISKVKMPKMRRTKY